MRNTARLSVFLIAFSTFLAAIFSSSCNNRENILLPPDLDPKNYVLSSDILVYSDHLIRSENDDSFLYLPKESISDSLIWYGDRVSFSRIDPILERDSLAVNSGSTSLSASYRVQVIRDEQVIPLESTTDFAEIYTDLTETPGTGEIATLCVRYQLRASPARHSSYGRNRVFFPIDGTGDFALARISENLELDLKTSGTDIQALLYASDIYLQLFIPSGFMEEAGNTRISLGDQASDTQNTTVSHTFPDFAMLTMLLEVTTQNVYEGTEVPILYYKLPTDRSERRYWLKLTDSGMESWMSSEQTWLIQDNTLVSFFDGSGTYVLIEALPEMEFHRINLGEGYRRIQLGDMWIDTSHASVPETDLIIYPEANTQELQSDYFGGTPYLLSGTATSFEIRFMNNNMVLETLPGDNWLELGFAAEVDVPANYRLLRGFRLPHKDIISYKTHATSYDEDHFSFSDGYVYSGVNSSGLYMFGKIGENSSTHQIPCLKDELTLKTQRTLYYYKDSAPPCDMVEIVYQPSFQSEHPWLNSMPYSLSETSALFEIKPIGSRGDRIPQMFYMETKTNQSMDSVVNFSELPGYPKFVRYNRKNALEHNSFVVKDGILRISPAYGGVVLNATDIKKARRVRDIRMYPKMVFDDYDLELYLDSDSTSPAGTMRISQTESFDDPFGVFENQYQIDYLSSVYEFKILDNSLFYESYQPFVRLKQSQRADNLLFSVSRDEYYRVYAYPEGSVANAWNFEYSEGHFAFYAAYDAQYGVVWDSNPHTAVSQVVGSNADAHLSLYQAQAVFPGYFMGNLLPMGTRLELSHTNSLSPGTPARAALRLEIRDPNQNQIQPNFFQSASQEWPYLYLPIPDYDPGDNLHVFYRSDTGLKIELSRVSQFGSFPAEEYMIIGNCAVMFIDNPGIFYVQ